MRNTVILFRPMIALGLALLPFVLLFTWLGQWQLQRMHEKQSLLDQFELASEFELSQAVANNHRFARVQTSGHYESSWHLLLDNQILNGRAGVHVLTLFQPTQGAPILVNRGWLPLPADRRTLPAMATPAGKIDISGILNQIDDGGVRLGNPDSLESLTDSRLITYLDIGALAATLGRDLSPWLIQLDADDPSGFGGRNWKPSVMLPEQHGAYALQWFALAFALVITWFALVWRWATRSKTVNAADTANKCEID